MAINFRPEFLRKSVAADGNISTHHIPSPVKTPRHILGNIAPRFEPLRQAQIGLANPAVLAAPLKTETSAVKTVLPTKKQTVTRARVAAAAAGTAVMLVPALAYAGTGIVASAASFIGGLGIISSIGLGIALIYTVRLLYSEVKAMSNRNLQSKKMDGTFANPTPRKLFTTLVLPAWTSSTVVGGALAYFDAIDWALASPGVTGYWAFAALAFMPVVTMLTTVIRDIYLWVRFKTHHTQPNLKKEHIIGQLATDIFQPAAWLATTFFMANLSEVYATQFLGLGFKFLGNLPGAFTTLAGASAMGSFGLAFALGFGLYRFFKGWRQAAIGTFADEVPSRLKSTLKASLIGAAVGAAIYLATPGMLVANLLTFAVTLAFAHSTIHSTMSQLGALRQANKRFPIFDLEDLWEAVRGRKGGTRTVFKPSIAMVDPLISSYVMVMITEGSNWVLNALTGAYITKDYKEAQEMIEKLLKKDAQEMRDIIKQGYLAVNQPGIDSPAAAQAMAEMYERLAQFLDTIAVGDLKTRSGGLSYLKDSTFYSGLPGASEKRGDQDLRVHGTHLHEAARIYQALAETIRSMELAKVDVNSTRNIFNNILEGLFRRSNPPMDTHPVRFYHNFLPDSYNAKQFAVDNFQQIMADFVGYMELPVMTADGRIRQYAIPMKVVKDFREDHTEVDSIKSRDTKGEDLRFGWYEREEHDIGDSMCDIAYIDNSAHFRKYQALLEAGTITDLEFLAVYPTAEVPTPPTLKREPMNDPYLNQIEAQEFYDVVYKNGSRLRIYADGSQQNIGQLDQEAPAVLMLAGTERHAFVGKMLSAGHGEVVFADLPVDPDLAKVMQTGTIPHPFGGNFNDSYLMPRWHFMYPTEYFSISDADQMDIIVTDLRLNHTRKNPHLRVMMVRPRTEELPYSPDMLEEAHDSFLEVGVAVVWMNMKITLKDGKQLYIPLNRNKENERTFGGELWRYIDQDRKVEIVTQGNKRFLKIPYRPQAQKDPAFRDAVKQGLMFGGKYNNRESIEYVPIPLEMQDMVDDIADVRINPERYGDVGGPRPVADYFFMRRNADGLVTDKTRQLAMTDRVANMLMFGKISLLSHREAEHWELVMKGLGKVEGTDQPWTEESPKEILPWVDQEGCVHMKLDKDEYRQLQPWIPEYFGKQQPVYKDGELLIYVKHFEDLCEKTYAQFTYRRFMPDYKFRIFWDAAEATLDYTTTEKK